LGAGGGAVYGNVGKGGNGVVIIAYPSTSSTPTISSGLTYTVSTVSRSGYRVYTFTAGTGTVTWA
jgi:hypothetical protein